MSNARDLLQLRELYKSGLLTEDEYVTARRKLLGYRSARIRRPSHARGDRGPSPSGGKGPSPRGGNDLAPRGGNDLAPPGGKDLPLLFALAALALVGALAAMYFLMFAK